jgi:hypothetical protein
LLQRGERHQRTVAIHAAMSVSGTKRTSNWRPAMSAFGGNLLQNYFAPWREEYFSKSSLERRILIQETVISDSDIPTFGDQLLTGRVLQHIRGQSGHRVDADQCPLLTQSGHLLVV